MKRIRFAACLAAALSVVLPSRAALTKIDVADNTTYELAVGDAANAIATQGTTGTMLKLGTGCTVKLVGDADGAVADFPLRAGIWCPSGDFTIDGSALANYSSTLRWYGAVYLPNGAVTLKGFKKVSYGSATLYDGSGLSTPCLRATDVLFDPADGVEGVEFVNSAGLCNALATCPWTVATGSSLWALDKNTINRQSEEDTFDVNGWNFGFIMGWTVANETVRIRDGHLYYRHCTIATSDASLNGWAGSSQNAAIENDLVLDGTATGLNVYSNSDIDHKLTGDITGTGSFGLYASSDKNVRIVFSGAAQWTGETVLASSSAARQGMGQLTFADPAPATSCIVISNTTASTVRFRPEGFGETATAVTVNGIRSDGVDRAIVSVEPLQTLIVGSLEGGATFRGDASGKVIVGNLAAGATIRSVGGVKIQVLASADGKANVILGAADDVESGTWELSGPATGTSIAFKTTEVVPGGTVAYAGCVAGIAGFARIMSKAALWCDASASDSFETIEDKSRSVDWKTADGHPYLWSWKDCRPGQRTLWLGNKRYYPSSAIGVNFVFGCLAAGTDANAPNGKPYVKMDSAGHYNVFMDSNGTINTKAEISAKYVILVYGSQQTGGGAAILGNQNGAFYRKPAGESWNVSAVALTKFDITELPYDGAVNGVTTNLSDNAKLNGGWQIISLDPGDATIQGVGFSANGTADSPGNRGYCNYAEVMLFGEKPTDAERKIVEEYLAAKYDLPMAHADTGYPLVANLNMTGDVTTPVLTLGDETKLDLTVNVNFPSKPKAGRYPLVANADLAAWTLGTVTGNGKYEVGLDYDADAKVLYADVKGPGLMVILK